MKRFTIIAVLFTLVSITGCATPSYETKSWSFSVAAPEHYRVWVEHLEFEKSGTRHWRMPVGGVDCCWQGSNGPSGPGGPITPFPDYIGIQWFSFAEQKFYQRLIPLPKNLKNEMLKPATYRSSRGTSQSPRDMIVIGLAPGGTIVLWIMNQIGNEIEVGRFQANEIEGDPEEYKAGTQSYLEEHGLYLEKHGIPTTGW